MKRHRKTRKNGIQKGGMKSMLQFLRNMGKTIKTITGELAKSKLSDEFRRSSNRIGLSPKKSPSKHRSRRLSQNAVKKSTPKSLPMSSPKSLPKPLDLSKSDF